MPQYRYRDARGAVFGEITVIEDRSMFFRDSNGRWAPGFEFIDSLTVRAHPFIINVLLAEPERLWTLDELLGTTLN